MKAAGSTPPVSASSILAAGAASSHGRTLALSSPQPEPTSPCPQSPQKPPLERRGDVNGYIYCVQHATGSRDTTCNVYWTSLLHATNGSDAPLTGPNEPNQPQKPKNELP